MPTRYPFWLKLKCDFFKPLAFAYSWKSGSFAFSCINSSRGVRLNCFSNPDSVSSPLSPSFVSSFAIGSRSSSTAIICWSLSAVVIVPSI